MFKLSDFLHLPELDRLIEQMAKDRQGLILIAGPDLRTNSSLKPESKLLPSGRLAIFNILFQEILAHQPEIRASIVSQERSVARVPRAFKRRVRLHSVEANHSYGERIGEAVSSRPGLLVVDELNDENIREVFAAALSGLRVLTQFDTGLWGSSVARQLLDFELSPENLSSLSWILTVQRVSKLCERCKSPAPITPEQLQRLLNRYPHLEALVRDSQGRLDISVTEFFQANGCTFCSYTSRHGDISAFDVFQAGDEETNLFDLPSRLGLETYLMHLAVLGQIPLEDILELEVDRLRRTYNLLLESESVLRETQITSQRRMAELEAANRVLLQRTEALMSIEDIGQILIASTSLQDLAQRVCRKVDSLCGADRAVLYYLRQAETPALRADVLAASGWDNVSIQRSIEASSILVGQNEREPRDNLQPPPGMVFSASAEGEKKEVKAGLRIPLVAFDNQVGAMIVHSTRKKFFSPGEIALLKTLANQAAVAIQRAGLIEDLRAKIVQLQAAQAELVHKERLEREMELARQVQQSMLPRTYPEIPGYRFASRNEPARQVGGDFYDILDLDDATFGILIADVSDKGMPAALYMALSRSLIIAEARRTRSPGAVLANANQLLLELGKGSQFVSVFYGVIEKATRRLTYVRAGHERPLLLRGEEPRLLEGEGMILGVLDERDILLAEYQLDLNPGDRLVLYTDGLTDVKGRDGRFFDLDRLIEMLRKLADRSPQEMCEATFSQLAEFQSGAERFDDMTLLILGIE